MIKTILVYLFIFSTSIAYSQKYSSIDFSIGGGSSFRSFSGYEEVLISDPIFDSRNLHERKMSHNIELTYSLNLTEKIKLRSGINYSQYNYSTTKLSGLRWSSEHNENGEWVFDPTLPHEIINSVSYSFIGIPMLLRYEIGKSSLKPFVEIGPSISILTNSVLKEGTDINSSEESIRNDRSSINLFARISAGVNFKMNKSLQLFGTFNYETQLNNIRNSSISEKLSNYGATIGVRQTINRIKGDNNE